MGSNAKNLRKLKPQPEQTFLIQKKSVKGDLNKQQYLIFKEKPTGCCFLTGFISRVTAGGQTAPLSNISET